MSVITEKISYLKGLAQGLKIEKESKEGQLISEVLNVLSEIADDIEYLESSQDELFERVYDLEDDLYGEESDEEYDYYNGDEDDEAEQFSIKCPNCNTEFFIDEDDLDNDEDLVCPSCNESIELDFGCDCGCQDDEE